MSLIEQIKRNQKDFQELYKQGVIGVNINGTAQLTTELFMKLTNKSYKILIDKVENSAYRYWLYAEIDGLRVFTILSEREMDELMGDLDG